MRVVSVNFNAFCVWCARGSHPAKQRAPINKKPCSRGLSLSVRCDPSKALATDVELDGRWLESNRRGTDEAAACHSGRG